jgi:hypothetical protein
MRRRASTIGATLLALLVAGAGAGAASADTIPVRLAVSSASPVQGDAVALSVLDPVGPCPQYAWSVRSPLDDVDGSYAAAPQIRLPEAGPYAVDVEVDDACDDSVRVGTLQFDVALAPLTRRLAVRYTYWTIADRLRIPRARLNARDQQFRVSAHCSRRLSQFAWACSFDGGCCENFIRGRGRIGYDPDGYGDRWRYRLHVAEGGPHFNGRRYVDGVTRRRTWVGSDKP